MAGKPKEGSGNGRKEQREKLKRGPKGKYTEDFPILAEKLAAQGLNDEQIAKGLNISLETYYSYQKKFPDFLEAIRSGKGPVDISVENALLKRARGYEWVEQWTEETIAPNGDKWRKVRAVKRHVPADVGALRTWLFNRRHDLWKNPDTMKPENGKVTDLPALLVEEIPLDDEIKSFLDSE